MKYSFSILLIVILSISSCTNNNKKILSGDLIFRGNFNSGLSQAINDVTKNSTEKSYSHVGICIIENDTTWVYDASPEKGVSKATLKDFCKPDSTNYFSDIYRIQDKNIPLELIKENINKHLGEPYDSTYIMESPGMYCSEFIYEIYKPINIFTLHAMTFKDPISGEIHPVWKDYYKKLGIDVPEGKPGCNPNQMAGNKNLIFMFRINNN